MSTKKKVIVVGGGYAGSAIARELDSKFHVTLIDRKKHFFHNIGALRATVDPTFVKKAFIPYDKLLKQGTFIHGNVLGITETQVILEGEHEPINFDFLVIATGSDYPAPAKSPADTEKAPSLYYDVYDRIKAAEKILIVGGGAVGTELAAEVATEFPGKKVVLVHPHAQLIGQGFKPSFYKKLDEKLKKLNIELILNDRVIIDSTSNPTLTSEKDKETVQDLEEGNTEHKGKGKEEEEKKESGELIENFEVKRHTYHTKNGQTIEADLRFLCTGIILNNQILKKNFSDKLDDKGFIKVNEFLQVEGHKNIFAIGDINNVKEIKLAYNAGFQVKTAVSNIAAIAADAPGKMKAYKPAPPGSVVCLGRNDGVSQFPGGPVVGGIITKTIKSKDLFVSRTWGQFNQKAPK